MSPRITLSIDWTRYTTHIHHRTTLFHDDPPLSQDDRDSTHISRTSFRDIERTCVLYDSGCKVYIYGDIRHTQSRDIYIYRTLKLDARDIYRGDMV